MCMIRSTFLPQGSFDSAYDTSICLDERHAMLQARFRSRIGQPLAKEILSCVDEYGHLDFRGKLDVLDAVIEKFGAHAAGIFDDAAEPKGASEISKVTLSDASPACAKRLLACIERMGSVKELVAVDAGPELRQFLELTTATNFLGQSILISFETGAKPDSLAIDTIESVLEGYLGVSVPPEINPRPSSAAKPKALFEKMKASIEPQVVEDFFRAYAVPSWQHDIRGQRCWIGDDKKGLLAVTLLRCAADDYELNEDVIHLYGQEGDPAALGCNPDRVKRLDNGDWTYALSVKNAKQEPGFWILRGDVPRQGVRPPRAKAPLLRRLPTVTASPWGATVFDCQAYPTAAIFREHVSSTKSIIRRHGHLETREIRTAHLMIPVRADTAVNCYAAANIGDELQVEGEPVFCWGDVAKHSDQMVICSLDDKKSSSLEARSCGGFAEYRPIGDAEIAQWVRKDGTPTDLHAFFKGKSGWFYHLSKTHSQADGKRVATKQEQPAVALTARESRQLRSAEHGDDVRIGKETVYVRRQLPGGKTEVWTYAPSDHLLALSGAKEHPEKLHRQYSYVIQHSPGAL